tara:strand:- start:44 stop:241 length:198 start_codon:yes stop_codon:yes gene_type:complete
MKAFIRLSYLRGFMRDPDTTVVYTFKNADGQEIVLKRDCPTNHVVDVYNELATLAQEILDSGSNE